jgi:hypothetical protein
MVQRQGQPLPNPKVLYSVTRLGGGVSPNGASFPGGLDQTTPSLALQPGALRDVLNYECSQSGGYSRIQGYERFDGRASPSAATFQLLQVASFVSVPSVGQVVSQSSSGASGTIIEVVPGSTPYIAVTQVSGTFDSTGTLTTPGPVTVGAAVTPMISLTAMLQAQYTAAAADVYRALIGAVPGSGSILGVLAMILGNADQVFAFRANANNTAVNIYQASGSGWTQVPLLDIVYFTQGTNSTAPPAEGGTLTQSGVTATIKRVVWSSGAWASSGGSAAGAMVITAPSGGNFASGSATTTDSVHMTLSGAQTAIVLQPGGRFQFAKGNLGGGLATLRAYGCDGVNQCFEFDGTILAPIATGNSPDAPSNITIHRDILWISQGTSVFYSAPGLPYRWSSVDGAGEIATGDTVTAMLTLPGSQTSPTLAVYQQRNTGFIYGTDASTFNYVTFNTALGALKYTPQNLFDTFFLDALGVVTLRTTLNWGNFLPSALTKNILPFVIQERDKITASTIQRSKSQYRLFFSDGFGLWATIINQQYLGSSVIQFPNPVYVVDEAVTTLNDEVSYFGSNDGQGYVYQLDSGTSFDGADLTAHITLAWDAIKSPEILKRFRMISVEMQGNAYAAITLSYQFSYSSTLVGQPAGQSMASGFSPAIDWDGGAHWDANFVWDGQTLAPSRATMVGTGENVQVTISSATNYIDAFTINSITYHYSMRRGLRG